MYIWKTDNIKQQNFMQETTFKQQLYQRYM